MQEFLFEDIINGKIKLSELANAGTTSRQYVYDEFSKKNRVF